MRIWTETSRPFFVGNSWNPSSLHAGVSYSSQNERGSSPSSFTTPAFLGVHDLRCNALSHVGF